MGNYCFLKTQLNLLFIFTLILTACSNNENSCNTYTEKEIKKSIQELEPYNENSQVHLDSIYKLAMNYYKLGKLEQASINFKEIIEIDPTYNCAIANKGVISYLSGHIEQACLEFIKAIELNCDLELMKGEKLSKYVKTNCN